MCTNARKFLFQHTQNKCFMKIFHIKKSAALGGAAESLISYLLARKSLIFLTSSSASVP